ncbi:hypothetical protein [Streptomyces sp. NBC_00046]|uniref:hypothetical protein n=1 Tax=Streptomyces sp. NBC_00046 TaxID=2975626 RepID=UPI00324DFED9
MAAEVPAHIRQLVYRLQGLREPVDAHAQLIHGDLTGNVLFASGQAPAVIDFSPYWRPVAYADAIVVVDGLLYHQAGPRLVDSALPDAEGAQMLLRALIFRLAASGVLVGRSGALAEDELIRFARVSQFVEERIGG